MAGPPFLSDDPEPADTGHWQIYTFVSGTQFPDGFEGQAGLNIVHGIAPHLEISTTIPLSFDDWNVGGLGDVTLASKYQFLHQASGSPLPDVSFNPSITIPAHGRFGSDRVGAFLPIWAEKDTGPWSVWGGGGYVINPASGGRNYWQAGLVVQRALGDRLAIGAEVYHVAAQSRVDRPFTIVDVGVTYNLTSRWALLGSIGPVVENAGPEGRFAAYLSLENHF